MVSLLLASLAFTLALFCNAIGIISIYEDWRVARLTILRALATFMFLSASSAFGIIGYSILTKGVS